MAAIAAGVLTFVALLVLSIMFVFPAVYSGVLGLFPSPDALATIVALAACVLVGYVLLQISVLVSAGVGVLTHVLRDR